MNILVSGGHGYVGSALVPQLLQDGHWVKVVDVGWFGKNIKDHEHLEDIDGDVREPEKEWFQDIDVVIHLAGVSNDPTAELSPLANYEINAVGTALMAGMAKKCGVKKFIFASTCSVYGFVAGKEISKENDKTTPKYPYGISKVMAEAALLALNESDFATIILRKGTIGGYAPRMRYDLVVNTMTKGGIQSGKIFVKHASQWRPVVDIRDVVRAYTVALQKPIWGIFNVSQGNYTIRQLGKMVAGVLNSNGYKVDVDIDEVCDLRNYKASNEKAQEDLEFSAEKSVSDTVTSILQEDSLKDFSNDKYYNIRIFEKLMQQERL